MADKDLSARGRIFDIQKFSTHDGPGIRTIVFFKGCMLRCRWCCNPESQSREIEDMVKGGKTERIGYDTTVGEILPGILRDMPYYRRSGGGLTLSGGECLLQPDFAEALLRCAKENGLSTAIESTACTRYSVIERLLPYVDHFLIDVKHTDSAKHQEFTTQPNEQILENIRKLAATGKSLTVRVPVIPTFNDTEKEILEIARFAASLRSVREMHLLPYHRLGYDKYVGLGRDYPMGDLPSPDGFRMEHLKTVAERAGIRAIVGG